MLGPNVAHCDIPTLKLGPNSEFGSHIEGRLSLSDPPPPPTAGPPREYAPDPISKTKKKKTRLKTFRRLFLSKYSKL
jgi:hypothetical protein